MKTVMTGTTTFKGRLASPRLLMATTEAMIAKLQLTEKKRDSMKPLLFPNSEVAQ